MTLLNVKRNNLPETNFSDILDDFFNWNTNSLYSRASSPSVNISENKEDYTLEVAAPGFKKSDFNVHIDNDLLTIEATREESKNDNEKNYTRREFSFSNFKRAFTLPDVVEGQKADAKYDDGILSVTLPKKDEAKVKPVKQINIH